MQQATTSYKLNAENAKQVGSPGRIQEKGAYSGVFTRAEAVVSREGTQGIEFTFKSNDGQSADYLTLWTINDEGKEIYGRKVVDALMTCMKLRGINAQQAKIKKYDHNSKSEVMTDALLFPDMMNKQIGLLLVREEYAKTDGTTGWKMTIVGAYDPATNKTPKEVLEGANAEALAKIIPTLQDRPLKTKPVPSASGRRQDFDAPGTDGYGRSTSGSRFDDMDDEIPF